MTWPPAGWSVTSYKAMWHLASCGNSHRQGMHFTHAMTAHCLPSSSSEKGSCQDINLLGIAWTDLGFVKGRSLSVSIPCYRGRRWLMEIQGWWCLSLINPGNLTRVSMKPLHLHVFIEFVIFIIFMMQPCLSKNVAVVYSCRTLINLLFYVRR